MLCVSVKYFSASIFFNFFFVLFQFLVFKFLEVDVDEDEACYDVGLAKWTGDMDDTMRSTTKWPDKSVDVGSLVRRQVAASPNWKSFPILIKRFYSKFTKSFFFLN